MDREVLALAEGGSAWLTPPPHQSPSGAMHPHATAASTPAAPAPAPAPSPAHLVALTPSATTVHPLSQQHGSQVGSAGSPTDAHREATPSCSPREQPSRGATYSPPGTAAGAGPGFGARPGCVADASSCAGAGGGSDGHGGGGGEAGYLRQVSGGFAPECRICLLSEPLGDLVAPCHCTGSMAYAHMGCLRTWVMEKRSIHCELCATMYKEPYGSELAAAIPPAPPVHSHHGVRRLT
ncbi:hypothetical protein GPECTOR_105g99 [Gonium pectorale]|uniref:RING-CH-type domain-containing protein n=1 Tax=Gonium pectorale TaxID=33097 RepID=A0A150FZQ5_GONPE|nr:hypothetical protein GPECTOR_105g99 [Gonium pectorale]|eukprot:KXZ43067.1 hypothetical protein GPECTOR_105g99 [Gonium pectorale]